MSWMKRPQAGAAPPRPEPQPQAFAAPQPYGNQQSMYPNYQGAPAAAQQQQQQMWAAQQQQTPQYGQVYQQQPFVNSSNQFFQQPQQYNQNYTNQNFDNVPQGYQQNYYHNQTPQQPNFTQNESSDTWEDNWGWGWEDSSKQQKTANQVTTNQPPLQAQAFNNANVIEESFASTQSWNWSMEDKNKSETQQPQVLSVQKSQDFFLETANVANHNTGNISEPSLQQSVNNIPAQDDSNQVRNLSDKEVLKEHLPNLAQGKRFHIENLTPQWSIESQLSQESSDGPLIQSEGTYRSENQSRNSSKSSPGPNTDTANFNYSLSGFNDMSATNTETSKHTEDSMTFNIQNNNRRESYDELANSVQEMTISNHENPAVPGPNLVDHNSENIKENRQPMMPPMPSVSPVVSSVSNQFIPQQLPMSAPPAVSHISQTSSAPAIPSHNSNITHPAPTIQPSANLPPPPALIPPTSLPPPPIAPPTNMPTSLAASHPPPNYFPPSSSQNPFKSASPFSHKNIPKIPAPNPQPHTFPPQVPSASLTAPGVVTQILQQDRLSAGFGANLETTPDNSERPDQPQMANYNRSMPVSQQVPDNLEIAPQNDRNQYLQTAHLSSGDYGENTDFSRNIAPPGPRRMGVGQQEVEYNQSLNISGEEPPPGLARMVPGQQNEIDNSYNQGGDDDYMDRQIDGQPMDSGGRPYRRADGQQTPDYAQASTNRGGDRRPVGLDRMVPGEPSNEDYPQYQTSNFGGASEHRVVTGVDRDYPIASDAGPSDIREQNVDGSDYTEPTPRNPSRSIIGARDASDATSPDFSLSVDDQQREITMEGENLQDLSSVSAADNPFSREAPYEGSNANVAEAAKDRHDAADSAEYPTSNSRRQSLNCVTSGEDSGRDRGFKASPRKERDKNKSKDRERDPDRAKDKDRGRYSRGDRKYDRESERRGGRRERDERERRTRAGSPDARRRRGARPQRYETEDTDYCSDRERERRQHREGSYTSSKPPRGDDKERRYDERAERSERGERRRHNTLERDHRYDDERARRGDRHRDRDRERERDRDRDRERDRFEHRYRDIDPRKCASLRRSKDYKDDDERRKAEAYSSGSRAGSREATATDDEADEPRRRAHRDQRRRHRHHQYYEGYEATIAAGAGTGAGAGWDEALEVQRRQYEYYERLRRADPAAYMRLYKQLLNPALYPHSAYADVPGYGTLGYEGRSEERASVHSGRSSANGLKPADTYYGRRDAASLRTDLSDRELTTDMSLNLHLEESTVRSERMTPFKYSTAHVKGTLSARALVVVRAGYPVDGRAAALSVLPLAQLLQRDPHAAELAAYPGPLLKGVTHKKSVVEYCVRRARDACGARASEHADAAGHALLWELLALLLRQNGVVVGSDIAELLMKNTKEFQYKISSSRNTESGASPQPGGVEGEDGERDVSSPALHHTLNDATTDKQEPKVDEREALDRFREYLIYGNRQEALEWAMRCGLWGHALQLAAHGERRTRAAVCARFVASLGAADPLHSLYAALAHRAPPAVTCVSDAHWGDWRPHAAIILSNASSKPEQDRRTLTQLGDSLKARGLWWSAQFCYVSAGVPFAAHPLAPLQREPPARVAPPRLALLLGDSRAATLPRFASNHAIFATEIYEYALSLSQDYVLDELTVYKLILATRYADAGQCERALGYAELAARAITRNPDYYSAALVSSVATLADRLKYYDPALQEDAGEEGVGAGTAEGGEGSEEASPRHQQWLRDVNALAQRLSVSASQQPTPQHAAQPSAAAGDPYGWPDQTLEQHQHQQISQQYADPVNDTTDYSHFQQQSQQQQQQYYQPGAQEAPEQVYQPEQQYGYEDQPYAPEPYWQSDNHYGYQDQSGALGGEVPRPTITMPGAAPAKPPAFGDGDDERPPSTDQTDRETDTPKPSNKKANGKSGESKGDDKRGKAGGGGGGGWLGDLFNKLSLRAPNQMILPDDTNPSIVWDEENKRWRDIDAAEGEAPAPPAPPPAIPAMSTSTPLQSPGLVGAPPTSNIFKMQKGRHIKNSYVDVLNPGGAARAPAAPPAAPLAAPPNYFIPAPLPPADQSGIYDPTQMAGNDGDFRSGI